MRHFTRAAVAALSLAATGFASPVAAPVPQASNSADSGLCLPELLCDLLRDLGRDGTLFCASLVATTTTVRATTKTTTVTSVSTKLGTTTQVVDSTVVVTSTASVLTTRTSTAQVTQLATVPGSTVFSSSTVTIGGTVTQVQPAPTVQTTTTLTTTIGGTGASSSPTPAPSGIPSCNVHGYDTGNHPTIVYDGSGTKGDFANCSALCNGNAACKSFAYGSGNCLLYDTTVDQVVNPVSSAPYSFNNKGCPAPPAGSADKRQIVLPPIVLPGDPTSKCPLDVVKEACTCALGSKVPVTTVTAGRPATTTYTQISTVDGVSTRTITNLATTTRTQQVTAIVTQILTVTTRATVAGPPTTSTTTLTITSAVRTVFVTPAPSTRTITEIVTVTAS